MALNQSEQSYGPEDFADKADRREKPAVLGPAGDLEIEQPVQADDHPQTGEYLRMVVQRHPCEPEQPLGVQTRKDPPPYVVRARDNEHPPVPMPPSIVHSAIVPLNVRVKQRHGECRQRKANYLRSE
jgi:hypothetical protein